MQDYKALCTAVTICTTMADIQTHMHRQHLISLYKQFSQLSLKDHTETAHNAVLTKQFHKTTSWLQAQLWELRRQQIDKDLSDPDKHC